MILATLCIVGISITQFYWVRRAFDLKEGEFERTVTAALNNVAQQIYDIKDSPSPAVNPVKQLSTNYFVVMVNSEVNAGLLEFLLKTEFERRNITVDFEYGIYDCMKEKMVYGNYVLLQGTQKTKASSLPKWSTEGSYFGVQFPNREAHILNQMEIWTFSSFVLLLVIVFFAYTLFIILKQKRLSEIQKDFINNMTHEFKTPIATIAVSAEVLKDPQIVNTPERLQNYAAIIQKENLRLKHQVERVLQMAQLDKEGVGVMKEAVDAHALLQEAIHNCSMLMREKQGDIRTALEAQRTKLNGDKLHLTNVFTNLIDNAIKYCTVAPSIQISTSNASNGIQIEIADNGIGIARDDQRKVFQKFFRVHTGNVHDVKGFGLGLSYVKTMVEAHGGTITLQSEPGKGSRFNIFLPAQ